MTICLFHVCRAKLIGMTGVRRTLHCQQQQQLLQLTVTQLANTALTLTVKSCLLSESRSRIISP